jgi:hypothetical protein
MLVSTSMTTFGGPSSWRRTGSSPASGGMDSGHSTKLMALSLSKGFHWHDEVLPGFTRSGQVRHFCFSA